MEEENKDVISIGDLYLAVVAKEDREHAMEIIPFS